MPLPLAIPLLIKGGMVAAKFIASKHAAATVAKAAVVAAKTYGTAATIGAAVNGLIVVGGVVWTVERFSMGKKALRLFDEGDWFGAANELTRIASSFYQVEGAQFADNINTWVSHGGSIDDPAFKWLISDLRKIVDEGNTTYQRIKSA